MILNIFVGFTALAIFFIANFVLVRNNKSKPHRIFGLFCLILSLWIAANFIGANFKSWPYGRYFVHIDFALGPWLAYLFYEFSKAFLNATDKSLFQRIRKYTYLLLTVVFSVISIPEGILVSTGKKVGGSYELVYTSLYDIYGIVLVVVLVTGILIIIRGRHRAKGAMRKQLSLILLGLGNAIGFVVIANLVVPQLTDSREINLLVGNSAYFGLAIFVVSTLYAIAKHKLFDIRAVVIRAVVYSLAIVVVGLVYTTVIFGLGSNFINVEAITLPERIFFGVMAFVIAVTYSPLIKFFNKVSSKLFFRDAYDSQDVLNRIGKIIVATIDLHTIKKASLKELDSAFRSDFAGFVLQNSTHDANLKDFTGNKPTISQHDLATLLHKVNKRTIVYDNIESPSDEVAHLMQRNNISIVVPLITKDDLVGHFVAGSKKSGNMYTAQDLTLLTIAANELAVALQNAQRFEEIQAFNITLQEKVAEATSELKKTNKKLIALDEAKDEFISMASHQLRTPLTSIKGYISMMLEGDLGKLSNQQLSAMKEAFASSQRMVFLIADFLNVSRIKTGKFMIEPKPVDLPQIVNEEITQLREMGDSRQLTIKYDAPHDFPTVLLDDNKIRQVMMNMVDNAIYYTPSGGTITIQLYHTDKEVIFKVIDTGIGVPKSEQHKLFSKFYRAGNARKARPDGTGLGLFMAQKIIVEQGGAIIFESEEGKGSTFGFRFPLDKVKT